MGVGQIRRQRLDLHWVSGPGCSGRNGTRRSVARRAVHLENMPENMRKTLFEAFGSLVRSEEDLLEGNR
jgi:hypothetical protein